MTIEKFGHITVTQVEGESHILIQDFTVDEGDGDDLVGYVLDYLIYAATVERIKRS